AAAPTIASAPPGDMRLSAIGEGLPIHADNGPCFHVLRAVLGCRRNTCPAPAAWSGALARQAADAGSRSAGAGAACRSCLSVVAVGRRAVLPLLRSRFNRRAADGRHDPVFLDPPASREHGHT